MTRFRPTLAALRLISGLTLLFYALTHLLNHAVGIFGIVAGLIILAKWPVSGLWVIGFLIGIDLLIHGFWWLMLGWHTYTKGDEPMTPEAAIYGR